MKTLIKDIKEVVNSIEFKNDEVQIEQLLIDFIKKDRTEQLRLHGVSQQRELLIEAFDLINIHDGNREKITKLVDITLKSINCG